jgi:hypothetical protein
MGANAMAAKVIEAIRGLERDRFRAMVEGNGQQLDALLSENVIYVHTNGKREAQEDGKWRLIAWQATRCAIE